MFAKSVSIRYEEIGNHHSTVGVPNGIKPVSSSSEMIVLASPMGTDQTRRGTLFPDEKNRSGLTQDSWWGLHGLMECWLCGGGRWRAA